MISVARLKPTGLVTDLSRSRAALICGSVMSRRGSPFLVSIGMKCHSNRFSSSKFRLAKLFCVGSKDDRNRLAAVDADSGFVASCSVAIT